MKSKKINIFLLLFLMTFIGIVNVCANTGSISWDGRIYFSGTGYELVAEGSSPTSEKATNYPHFRNKYSDAAGSLICTTGFFVDANIGGSCNIETLSKGGIGSAYIINEYTGAKGGVKILSTELKRPNYYWTEVGIIYYLGQYQTLDTGTTASGHDKATLYAEYKQRIESLDASIFPNKKTFAQTLQEAANYEAMYSDAKYSKNVELDLSETNLEFTLNDDGYYYSQKVYVTDKHANGGDIRITYDNNNFVLVRQNDATGLYFQLKIDKNKVSSTPLKVNVTAEGGYEYYTAYYYDCAAGYQDLVNTQTNKVSKSDSVAISGEVASTEIIIEKYDENGKFLPGVTIKVESSDKKYSEGFVTSTEPIVIKDLEYGKYIITEVTCPDGYVKLKGSRTITLSKENLSQTVKLNNKLTRVEIHKVSASDNKPLAGAVLQIQDKDGNVLKDTSGKAYEWTTTEESYVIEGLQYGTYYLVEKSSPEGYELNTEKIKFVVDDETAIVEVKMKNNLEVKVPDTLSSRSTLLIAISMFDIALGIGLLTYVKKNKVQE